MTTITDNDVKNLTNDLATALLSLSKGKLDAGRALAIAKKSVSNIDLKNSALAHKGTNWYAKEIIKVLGI